MDFSLWPLIASLVALLALDVTSRPWGRKPQIDPDPDPDLGRSERTGA